MADGSAEHGRTSRRYAGPRYDQRACGPVLLLSAGAAGRRGDQGRGARLRRSGPAAGRRSRAQPPRHGRILSRAERGKTFDHAESEIAQGPRCLRPAGRHLRCRGGEFPPRRDGAARARLRRAQGAQDRHHLLRDLRLRPGRAAQVQSRLRSDHPGSVRRHERDRRRAVGAAPGRVSGRRHDGRHLRRLRHRRGAVSARAKRGGRVHRRLHAGSVPGRHGLGGLELADRRREAAAAWATRT